MRAKICEKINNNEEVWILSIAGCKIVKGNTSNIDLKPNSLICLAKAIKALTWEEYSAYIGKRKDAIYKIENNKPHIIENPYHTTKDNLETDTGDINIPQIIMSNEYYFFDGKAQLPNELIEKFKARRGYKCRNICGRDLKELLKKIDTNVTNKISFTNN